MSREWLKPSSLLARFKPKSPVSQANDVLRSEGSPLDAGVRTQMESRFGRDFSQVRVHADTQSARSARALQAQAYTVGQDIVFGKNSYAPDTVEGQNLLAHELTHVVQQGSATRTATGVAGHDANEVAAENQAAGSPTVGTAAPLGAIQRRVQMRDVGKGEQSGLAKLPDLVARLNAVSGGLTFSLSPANDLTYEVRQQSGLTEFDRQMMGFIDQATLIPLRLTKASGRGEITPGVFEPIFADRFDAGYVDVDDLLASDALSFQFDVVHFMAERAATKDYARRIGTFTEADLPEFNRSHNIGLQAEIRVLQDFFSDPTIRFLGAGTAPVFRVWRNSDGDFIRARGASRGGLDVMTVEVTTRDGKRFTAEGYKSLREQRSVKKQIEGERLRGATEHREGGRNVPAP